MLEPGAKISIQEPQLEKLERASVLVDEATVIAAGTLLGEPEQASVFELPAATAKVTPALIALLTAESNAAESPPPKLILATAGNTAFCATQSRPAITPEFEPEP